MVVNLNVTDSAKAIAYLRNPLTIRSHARQLRKRLEEGGSEYFYYHPERWGDLCDLVCKVCLQNYPDLEIPFHSRWRHFNIGNVDRLKILSDQLNNRSNIERARVQIELVIISVLLDAGAGFRWKYYDALGKQTYTRSEGLALASLYLYWDGALSNEPSKEKFAVHGARLRDLRPTELSKTFQVSEANPLEGIEGRCSLLTKLGETIESRSDLFPRGRLGDFFDVLLQKAEGKERRISAETVLSTVIDAFQDIWPSRLFIGASKLGDVGRHSHIKGLYGCNGLAPFHKLSQWLSYSLIEPLQEAGMEVLNLDNLTGLPEYRNGGLFLDGALLSLKDPKQAELLHDPHGELITEWRALTLCFLDELAVLVRKQLKAPHLTLASILQGGTWYAGRQLAFKFRKDGAPPLQFLSDGTIF